MIVRLTALLLTCLVLMGWGCAEKSSPKVLNSPEIAADHTVTFRLQAPKASNVVVESETFSRLPLRKGGNGVWSGSIRLDPGLYEYRFLLDGIHILDPHNHEMKDEKFNFFIVPAVPPALYEVQPVPHGVVHVHYYQSQAFEETRRVHVYTPPSYDPFSPTRYPVLYLLNGGADDDATWTIIGRANLLMDNLLAEGKIMPMILVMPNGRPKAAPPWREDDLAVAERDMLGQVIPLIESSYRVRADANHRAISGISMGGMQTLLIGLRHLDMFAYLIPLSIRPGFDDMDLLFGEDADNYRGTNARLRLLSIYCGTGEHKAAITRQVDKWLSLHRIHHELHRPPGKHNWQLWRSNLAEFAPRLFRD